MTSKSTAISPPANARVLVVDDSPSNIQSVRTILEKPGYAITAASDGPTALKQMESAVPDLVLLDVIMPHMNGFEVCRRIREHAEWKDIPIIFISAADDKDLIVRGLEEGGVDYVTKPFNGAELLSRVRTHLTLKAARDQLKQLVEDKDELLGILTHDLKNHLSGMQLSAEVLRDMTEDLANPRVSRLFGNMCQSSEQLLMFVKEFLANTSRDHGLSLHREIVSVSEAVSCAVQQYREAAIRKELAVQVVLPPGDTYAWGDATGLNQVLDNLLSNAVKFSQPQKEINVTVQVNGNYVECSVRDQGPGFSTEDKGRMFRRYGRLSARPTGGEPSTGLGLSIVKKIVAGMNGEVQCMSEPGQGTNFIVRLEKAAPTD